MCKIIIHIVLFVISRRQANYEASSVTLRRLFYKQRCSKFGVVWEFYCPKAHYEPYPMHFVTRITPLKSSTESYKFPMCQVTLSYHIVNLKQTTAMLERRRCKIIAARTLIIWLSSTDHKQHNMNNNLTHSP